MSIRCGHCRGHHDTVAEVRGCGQVATVATPMATVAPLAAGYYGQDGHVYRVAIGQESGRPWAEVMTADGKAWTYAPGAVRRLSVADRLSAEDLAAVGRLLVRCVICGARLTRPESVARGIGPICATKV